MAGKDSIEDGLLVAVGGGARSPAAVRVTFVPVNGLEGDFPALPFF